MAEERRSIIQHIHLHVNASSLTDETTIVHGDQVGTKMDVAAGRIGAVNMPGTNAGNAGEERIVEGVEQMNLAKKTTTSRGAISKPKKSSGKSGPNAGNAYEQQVVEGVDEMNLSNPSAFANLQKFFAGKGSNQKENANIVAGVEQMNLGRTESDDILTRRNIRQPSGCPQTDIPADSSSARPELNKAWEVRIGFLKERCSILLGQSEYEKAAPILEEIISLEETANFNTRLQMAECYLHLGRDIKAMQAVRDIIMTSQSFTAYDICKLGIELVGNSSHIRGIILLCISSDMYETNATTPDDVVNGIYCCIANTGVATQPLIEAGGRSRVIGLDIGVENMYEMNQRLKAVKNAKPENKALTEARSNEWIGYNLVVAGEIEKSIDYRKTGIEILERQFLSNAAKYQVYGQLLYNLGVAHHNLGNYSEAETYYVKAIEAKEKATDFSDESAKQKDIEVSKTNLKHARTELGK